MPGTKKKKSTASTIKRKKKLSSELMTFRMELLKSYIQSGKTRSEQNKRREEIAKLVSISPATVKSYYLYGQGPAEKWDAITSHITKVDESICISLYNSHPYISGELKKLPKEKSILLSNIGKLSNDEVRLLNGIIELCIKANKLGKK